MTRKLMIALVLSLTAGPALAVDDRNDNSEFQNAWRCETRDDRCYNRDRDRHSRDREVREWERSIRDADRIGDRLGVEVIDRDTARIISNFGRFLD